MLYVLFSSCKKIVNYRHLPNGTCESHSSNWTHETDLVAIPHQPINQMRAYKPCSTSHLTQGEREREWEREGEGWEIYRGKEQGREEEGGRYNFIEMETKSIYMYINVKHTITPLISHHKQLYPLTISCSHMDMLFKCNASYVLWYVYTTVHVC